MLNSVTLYNDLDSITQSSVLGDQISIDGVCIPSPIGGCYNNLSFGCGGCCLPRDANQRLASDRSDVMLWPAASTQTYRATLQTMSILLICSGGILHAAYRFKP